MRNTVTRIYLTEKQERQIISFFETSNQIIGNPHDLDNSAVIALFRACRDYCNKVAGGHGYARKGVSSEVKAEYRKELINHLDVLSIRYYQHL